MKTWVFDLDGTLVDSFQHYYWILESLTGRAMTEQEKKSVVAQAPHDFLKENFPLEQVPSLLKIVYERSLSDARNIQPFPEAFECLDEIRAKGHKTAIFTNRDLVTANEIVKHSGLSKFVDHVVSGTCVQEKKPSPEGLFLLQKHFDHPAKKFIMIGDHDVDIEAAKGSQALAVRASWHNYWTHEGCTKSDLQFYSFSEFNSWTRRKLSE